MILIAEPPSKKRKTDTGMGDDDDGGLWDDSMEFTQADLEDIEIQASQVKPDHLSDII